jgi:hypothetical protein
LLKQLISDEERGADDEQGDQDYAQPGGDIQVFYATVDPRAHGLTNDGKGQRPSNGRQKWPGDQVGQPAK